MPNLERDWDQLEICRNTIKEIEKHYPEDESYYELARQGVWVLQKLIERKIKRRDKNG